MDKALYLALGNGFTNKRIDVNTGTKAANDGDSAQFLFLARAVLAGYTCSNVDVRSSRYDAVIDFNGHLLRVQVKGIKETSKESPILLFDEEKFIRETADDAISRLSKKDKKALLDNPDPLYHHFGYGMYIRNRYIHNKKLGVLAMDKDGLSTQIVEEVIKRLLKEGNTDRWTLG